MGAERSHSPSPLVSPEAQVSGEASGAPAALPGAPPSDAPSSAVPDTPVVPTNPHAPFSAPSTTPWDQTPEFLVSSDWTIYPGAPTEYNPPRTTGKGGPTDITSLHPAQATWSEDNLPDIFYTYKPPQNWLDFYENTSKRRQLPPPKTDASGDIMYERWPTDVSKPDPLLDFPHLPNQIGTKEAWWTYEAWRRYDPRIRWKDILMRQQAPHRSANSSVIQSLVSHNRPAFKIASWHPPPPTALGLPERPIEWLPEMSEEQRRRNTTRGLTPGLIDPGRGEEGGRVAVPKKIKGAGVSKGRREGKAKAKDAGGEKNRGGDSDSAPKSPQPKKRRRTSSPGSTAPPLPPPRGAYTLENSFLSSPYTHPSTQVTPSSSTRFGIHPASEEGRYSYPYQPPPPSPAPAGRYSYSYSPPAPAPAPAYGAPPYPNPYPAPGYPDPRQTTSHNPPPMPLPRRTQLAFAQHGVYPSLRRGYGFAPFAPSSWGPPPPPQYMPQSFNHGATASQVPASSTIRYDTRIHPPAPPPPPLMEAERDWMENFVDFSGMESSAPTMPAAQHTSPYPGFRSPAPPFTNLFSPPMSAGTPYQPQAPGVSNQPSTTASSSVHPHHQIQFSQTPDAPATSYFDPAVGDQHAWSSEAPFSQPLSAEHFAAFPADAPSAIQRTGPSARDIVLAERDGGASSHAASGVEVEVTGAAERETTEADESEENWEGGGVEA